VDRENLMAELNKLAANAAELRSADTTDTDAILDVTARINAVRAELSVIDARDIPAAPVAAPSAHKSFGSAAVETGVFDRGVGASVVVERDIFTGTGVAGALDIIVPDFTPGIDARPRAALTLLDVMPAVPTSSDTVVFFVQTGFTNNAAGVPRRVTANGSSTYGSYQLSDIEIVKKTAAVAKIGHALITDEDSLADRDGLSALLNSEGVYGVREAVERQLLGASDTANGLSSLIVTGAGRAQSQEYAFGGDGADLLDAIRQAKTKAEVAQLPADFVVLSPEAKELVELAKDGEERYLGAGPFAGANGTIWGLAVVTSYNLPEGVDAVVGSTRAVRLRVRRGVEVAMSNSHEGLFLKDGLAIKVSGRFAVENTRPEAMVVISQADSDEE
jgi:HK97 family phage major capsid protein